jgi:hypothetical protein
MNQHFHRNLDGVEPRIASSLLRACTPSHPSLSQQTMAGLIVEFDKYGHKPSEKMWAALEAAAQNLQDQADGVAGESIYVSSLDPGVGKTQTLIHFLRVLVASPDHADVAVLVCVSRLEQVKAIVEAAGLSPSDFAVITSDSGLNDLGADDPTTARVLFTTHQMVLKRAGGGDFRDARDFHYRHEPREVRIWDEAILPGETLTVSRYQLSSLFEPLAYLFPALVRDLEALFERVKVANTGDQIELEDLSTKHRISAGAAIDALLARGYKNPTYVETLWKLFGRMVSVRHDGPSKATMLDYEETLPKGIAPMLVLDASARVRRTYDLWARDRGGMVCLPSAPKDYRNLRLHVWNRGGGKGAFRRHTEELIDAIASTILTKPNEEWLVFFHKGVVRGEFADHVRALLPETAGVHFVNWGAHDATNAFAHVSNVILAGTLFYPESYYEALGRMAQGRPSSSGAFSEEELKRVCLGEHQNVVLQAVCRGAVRRCEGDQCPNTDAYIIARTETGIPSSLSRIFPGAVVVPWKPIKRALTGKVAEAITYLDRCFHGEPTAEVRPHVIMQHIGVSDRSNFRKTIRQHPDFIDALAERGIVEMPVGRGVVFVRGAALFADEEYSAEISKSLIEQ